MFKPMSQSAGYSLLEILVAALVVSVGLLAVASLQLKGQQVNYQSYIDTQATILAYDLMERIRLNNDPPPGGAYSKNGQDTCKGKNCSWGDQLAAYDKAVWSDLVAKTLPGGQGTCCSGDGIKQLYKFTIQWTKKQEDGQQPEIASKDWYVSK